MEWQKYLARLRYYDRMCGNLPTVHQKIAQVQAVVKAYSRHEIPQEVCQTHLRDADRDL